MPEKTSELMLPQGFMRAFFRFPIALYHAHLGWMLGYRFVLLTHTGYKTGRIRQAVLEIVRYDKASGGCIVASGWGTKSAWYKNITAHPEISIQIQNKHSKAVAIRLTPELAATELLDYSKRNPFAMKELAKFMGYELNGTDDDIRELGKLLPMFFFKPIKEDS